MRVNAAGLAEVMLGLLRIEAIGAELILARADAKSVRRRCHRYGAPHPAYRACAAPCRRKTFGQSDGELDGAAMAGAVESDWLPRRRVDHAATFSSASFTASSASWALP